MVEFFTNLWHSLDECEECYQADMCGAIGYFKQTLVREYKGLIDLNPVHTTEVFRIERKTLLSYVGDTEELKQAAFEAVESLSKVIQD